MKLKGANRHENWPDTGHAVTEERMIRDLEVLKQGNCNHVRTCHYSDDPRWYELCDEWGIYLVAEANCECHGYNGRFDNEPLMRDGDHGPQRGQRGELQEPPLGHHVVAGQRMRRRGKNFIAALNAIKAIDPTRPVHYERFGIGAGNPADVDSQMYGTPAEFERIAADPDSDQAVLHVRIRPRHVQLDGLDWRIQRRLRPLPGDRRRRDLGMAGPGHLEPPRPATIPSSPTAAASAKCPTTITSSTRASSSPTARPSRIIRR